MIFLFVFLACGILGVIGWALVDLRVDDVTRATVMLGNKEGSVRNFVCGA